MHHHPDLFFCVAEALAETGRHANALTILTELGDHDSDVVGVRSFACRAPGDFTTSSRTSMVQIGPFDVVLLEAKCMAKVGRDTEAMER